MHIDTRIILYSMIFSVYEFLHLKYVKTFFLPFVKFFQILKNGRQVSLPNEKCQENDISWLHKILKIHFRTFDGNRSFSFWIAVEVPAQVISSVVIEVFFEKNCPQSKDSSVLFNVPEDSDFVGEDSCKGYFIYNLKANPATEWYKAVSRKRIKGQLAKLNIDRITVYSEGNKKTFFKCRITGIFYPFKTLGHYLVTNKREAHI